MTPTPEEAQRSAEHKAASLHSLDQVVWVYFNRRGRARVWLKYFPYGPCYRTKYGQAG
jgi:hypothetical protein